MIMGEKGSGQRADACHCEDQQVFADSLAGYLKRYAQEKQLLIDVRRYPDGATFVDE